MPKIRKSGEQKVTSPERDEWSSPAEFFLTLVAYCVGTGNFLRFPYLCMRYGGGSFLVAYFTCLFVCGCPLYVLEMAIGQHSQLGCYGVWDRYLPIFRGTGYVMLVTSLVTIFYSQTYMAWILYYFSQSLTTVLPWTTCNATWNTPTCLQTVGVGTTTNNWTMYSGDETDMLGDFSEGENGTDGIIALNMTRNTSTVGMSAVEEYFQYGVLRLSSGISEIGFVSWQLCVAHLVSWVLMGLCLIKGIKSAGKVVWVSAILPYILLTVFLVRAALLPGFQSGIHYYLTPKFEQLTNPEVWLMAFLQIFYTLGPGWGGIISMSSHNKYHHNFLIEGLFCPILCCMTSFFAGFSTFGAAGFLAYKKGIPVEEALATGPGVAFITYPELAAHLPAGPFWSALFFLMMILVLIDTLLVMMETSIQAICELFAVRKSKHKYVLLAFALFNFFGGLIFFTEGGMYVFQLMDWYCATLAIFLAAASECVCVTVLYGWRRFYKDVTDMIGPRVVIKLMMPLWAILIPILLVISLVISARTLSKPVYGNYVFPDWSATVGWTIAVTCVLPAAVWPIYRIISISGAGFRDRFRALCKPDQGVVAPQVVNGAEPMMSEL